MQANNMSNETKQTAVEWYHQQIVDRQNGNGDSRSLDEIYEQAKEMENKQQPIKVKAIQDNSYHWYVVPNELYDEFLIDEQNEDMIDSGEFDAKWGEYRTGGDLNLIQLYTYGGNK